MSKHSKKSKKQPLRRRTKFTILAILNIIWYTVIVLILSFFDHVVPAELTTAWFAAWTIELALLYGIKVKSKDAPSSEYNDMPDYIDESTQVVNNTPSEDDKAIDVQDESNVPDYDEEALG
jgi:hypothetical protein